MVTWKIFKKKLQPLPRLEELNLEKTTIIKHYGSPKTLVGHSILKDYKNFLT